MEPRSGGLAPAVGDGTAPGRAARADPSDPSHGEGLEVSRHPTSCGTGAEDASRMQIAGSRSRISFPV